MKNKPLEIEGRAWVILDESGNPIDDIDTDQIYHNAHLAVTEISEMGKYAFGNLKGYETLKDKIRPGDIIVTGRNFGAGSSRQHAVDCFKALSVGCIICESAGAIYKRNAINSGFPLVIAPDIISKSRFVETGDILKVNFETGTIKNLSKNTEFQALPFSEVQKDIYKAGSIFVYAKLSK